MAGLGDLLAGGIVGKLCSDLFNLVVDLINKTNKFSALLEALKITVGDLDSLIPKIQRLNEKLNISNKGTDRLKNTLSDGIKLVGECSRDPKWYKKSKYTEKLTALDEALERELNILPAHAAIDMKEALLLSREHHKDLVELARDGREGLETALVLARTHRKDLVELARDGRKGLETALQKAREHHEHLVELAKKQSDQLVELARDGRETLDAVKEIKLWLNFYALNFIEPRPSTTITTWLITSFGKATTPTLVKYDADSDEVTTPTPVNHDTDSDKTTTPTRPLKKKDPEGLCLERILSRVRKRIATAVQDGIILSVRKVCKWGVQWAMLILARIFVLLLVLANFVVYIVFSFSAVTFFSEEFDKQLKRGLPRRDLRKLKWLAFSVLIVLNVCAQLILFLLRNLMKNLY